MRRAGCVKLVVRTLEGAGTLPSTSLHSGVHFSMVCQKTYEPAARAEFPFETDTAGERSKCPIGRAVPQQPVQ